MALRFIMVKNSLKAGKPSEERLKTLKQEFCGYSIAGVVIFLAGISIPCLALPLEHAEIITTAGGVIFGLGIPQYIQWRYGKVCEAQIKESLKQVNKLVYFTLIPGVALIVVSGFISA